MLAAGVTSAAGLSLAFAGDYLATFIDVPAIPAAVVFLTRHRTQRPRGISESMKSNAVLTVIELTGLLIVIVAGAVLVGRGGGDIGRVVEVRPDSTPGAGHPGRRDHRLLPRSVGPRPRPTSVEEIRNPSKVYPRALFAALITAGVIYVLVGLASAAVLSPEELAQSSGPLLDVVSASGLGVPLAWAVQRHRSGGSGQWRAAHHDHVQQTGLRHGGARSAAQSN